MKNAFLLFLGLIFVSSCASSYYPIQPGAMSVDRQGQADGVNYGYSKNVLSKTGNKKYAKKEVKRGICVLSIKIKNDTEDVISVKDDLIFKIGGKELDPLETIVVTDNIKQLTPVYALYGLLFLNITNNNQSILLPIGVPIAVGNMVVASSANSRFREDFTTYNVRDERLAPGDAVNGLIAFRDNGSGMLEISLRD